MCTNAFTLVEMLLVVALIALLISLLLPALSRVRESARRSVCASQLQELHTSTISFALDNVRRMPRRSAGASGYAGGLHNDALPAADAGHWGRQWDGYIPDLEFDGEGSRLLFCPSMDNPRQSWRPTFQPVWRNMDYAFWPSMKIPLNNSGAVNWVPTASPSSNLGADPLLPMWGDSIMEFWHFGEEWFISGHPATGRGHNSYAENTSQAERPEGGNQVRMDGSAAWNDIENMQPAVHMIGWGADAGKAFQYWSFDE